MLYSFNNDGVIWITGASSGIGFDLAKKYAKLGNKVAVTSRSIHKQLFDDYEYKENIYCYPADITDNNQIIKIIDQIEADLGPISLGILNAGGYFFSDFRKTINLNLVGTYNCLERLYKSMSVQRQGHIAIVSSISGHVGIPNFHDGYISSKAALIKLAECIKKPYAEKNIRVQLISPGFVKTNLISDVITPHFMISIDEASNIIIQQLKTSKFEIKFPFITNFIIKFIQMLPYRLYFIGTKILGKKIKTMGNI